MIKLAKPMPCHNEKRAMKSRRVAEIVNTQIKWLPLKTGVRSQAPIPPSFIH